MPRPDINGASGGETGGPRRRTLVSRTSLSLPEELLEDLDAMVAERGFASRSQGVATILRRSLVAHRHEVGDRVMVGTITLFYDNKIAGLRERLAENQTLEVMLVQGPARALQRIADLVITQTGVLSRHLELAAALIPQVHPFR